MTADDLIAAHSPHAVAPKPAPAPVYTPAPVAKLTPKLPGLTLAAGASQLQQKEIELSTNERRAMLEGLMKLPSGTMVSHPVSGERVPVAEAIQHWIKASSEQMATVTRPASTTPPTMVLHEISQEALDALSDADYRSLAEGKGIAGVTRQADPIVTSRVSNGSYKTTAVMEKGVVHLGVAAPDTMQG